MRMCTSGRCLSFVPFAAPAKQSAVRGPWTEDVKRIDCADMIVIFEKKNDLCKLLEMQGARAPFVYGAQ